MVDSSPHFRGGAARPAGAGPVDRASPGRAQMVGTSVFELDDVCIDSPRGGLQLVSEASFIAERGEVVVVVGAASAGTSRLVSAVLGEVPYTGRISLFGRDVAKLRRSSARKLRRTIGVVPQDLRLLERLSGHDNVALPLEIDGVPRSISALRTTDVLVRLGLEAVASRPVSCLSNSERQRVAVARALIRDPELVLADQPTCLQDIAGVELVCEAFAAAATSGACVVAFAHNSIIRSFAQRYGWRQMAIVDGRIDPIALSPFGDTALEEAFGEFESMAHVDQRDGVIRNVISFPQPSRTTGVA